MHNEEVEVNVLESCKIFFYYLSIIKSGNQGTCIWSQYSLLGFFKYWDTMNNCAYDYAASNKIIEQYPTETTQINYSLGGLQVIAC